MVGLGFARPPHYVNSAKRPFFIECLVVPPNVRFRASAGIQGFKTQDFMCSEERHPGSWIANTLVFWAFVLVGAFLVPLAEHNHSKLQLVKADSRAESSLPMQQLPPHKHFSITVIFQTPPAIFAQHAACETSC